MKIDNNSLYILIEGESNSPEIAFINRVIGSLVSQGNLPNINYRVIEVGGSSNFSNIAKIIYNQSIHNQSSLHRTIPVIAIVDKDFRTQELVNNEEQRNIPHQLIENKNPRKIYWRRHEWENFLLEETEIIANILNRIPPSDTPISKPFRKNITDILTKQKLDDWLLSYFRDNVINELSECLRFRFRQKTSKRLNLDKNPSLSLSDVNPWFKYQIIKQAKESRRNIFRLKSMVNDTLGEYIWTLFTNDYDQLNPQEKQDFFQEAKIYFRGKEVLKNIFNQANDYLLIQDLSYEKFTKNLILPELEKNINSLIIQELKFMLFPYFNEAINHQ